MQDKYDLLEIIDDGAFGKKYKAKLKSTGELKVMKILDKKKMIEISGEDFFKN